MYFFRVFTSLRLLYFFRDPDFGVVPALCRHMIRFCLGIEKDIDPAFLLDMVSAPVLDNIYAVKL